MWDSILPDQRVDDSALRVPQTVPPVRHSRKLNIPCLPCMHSGFSWVFLPVTALFSRVFCCLLTDSVILLICVLIVTSELYPAPCLITGYRYTDCPQCKAGNVVNMDLQLPVHGDNNCCYPACTSFLFSFFWPVGAITSIS